MVVGMVEIFRLLIKYITAYFTTGRLLFQCVSVYVHTRGGVPRNFVGVGGGGVQQIQLWTEDRENRDLGTAAF